MSTSAQKPEASPDSDPDSTQVRRVKRRKALIKDEFDTACWEPSLKERLHKAVDRKKS